MEEVVAPRPDARPTRGREPHLLPERFRGCRRADDHASAARGFRHRNQMRDRDAAVPGAAIPLRDGERPANQRAPPFTRQAVDAGFDDGAHERRGQLGWRTRGARMPVGPRQVGGPLVAGPAARASITVGSDGGQRDDGAAARALVGGGSQLRHACASSALPRRGRPPRPRGAGRRASGAANGRVPNHHGRATATAEQPRTECPDTEHPGRVRTRVAVTGGGGGGARATTVAHGRSGGWLRLLRPCSGCCRRGPAIAGMRVGASAFGALGRLRVAKGCDDCLGTCRRARPRGEVRALREGRGSLLDQILQFRHLRVGERRHCSRGKTV